MPTTNETEPAMKHRIALLIMRPLIVICLITVAIAGCSKKPQARTPTITSERYQVAETALRQMMDEYSATGTEHQIYSAYVLDGGEFTSQLVAAFSGYKPNVVANIQIQYASDGAPTNKANGKPVELWKVENVVIHGDHATANVFVYQASEGSEYFTVHLQHLNGKWIFESKTLDIVS